MLRPLAIAALLLALPTAAAFASHYTGSVRVWGPGPTSPCDETGPAEAVLTNVFVLEAGQHCNVKTPLVLTWEYDERSGYVLSGPAMRGLFWEDRDQWRLELEFGGCLSPLGCLVSLNPTFIQGAFETGTIII